MDISYLVYVLLWQLFQMQSTLLWNILDFVPYSYDMTRTQSSLTDHDSYPGLGDDTICIASDVMTHLGFLLVAIVRLHSLAPNTYKHGHGLCTVLRQYIRTMDSTTTLQSSLIRLKSKSHASLSTYVSHADYYTQTYCLSGIQSIQSSLIRLKNLLSVSPLP